MDGELGDTSGVMFETSLERVARKGGVNAVIMVYVLSALIKGVPVVALPN